MKHSIRLAAVAAVVLAAVAALVVPPLARSQVQATPVYLPIGVASAGNASMVWFHEPSTGRVLTCQASAGAGGAVSPIQCTTAKMP